MNDHISVSSAEETPMEEPIGPPLPPGVEIRSLPDRNQLTMEWFGSPNSPNNKYPTGLGQVNAANQWYDKCNGDIGYTEAIIIPGNYGETDGCFVVTASDESCRLFVQQAYRLMEENYIDYPHWLAMSVYWISQMTTTNIKGISSPEARRIGCLFEVVDDIFQRRQKPQWMHQYCHILPTYPRDYIHKAQLRHMIWAAFDTRYIVEYVSALAWQCFRTLEVYTRVSTADTDIPIQQSRHIVYDHADPWSREDKQISDWWKYDQGFNTFTVQPINEWMQERMPYPHEVLPVFHRLHEVAYDTLEE